MLHIVKLLVVVGMLIASASAHADRHILWLDEGVDLGSRRFSVANVTANNPGAEDMSAARDLQENLISKLTALGVLASTNEATEHTVVVDCRIMKYASGSVAGRWIGGRVGAADIIVRVTLSDNVTHVLLGDMVSIQEVRGGGLFSIGAEKAIIRDAAEEIARGISDRLNQAR